jgi:osmoprotectant transport system permease protein
MSLLDGPGVLAAPAAENPWLSWRYVRDNAESIRAALIEHVLLTAESVLIAAVIGVTLAIFAYQVRRLSTPILVSTGVLYTVPSLGLLAILGPLMPTRRSAVVVALVTYALLVIVRNTLTALLQVPGEVREAATAMGYGRFARLWRVELPLAVPGMLTGLRLATVSTVALVTVGDIVGNGALGTLLMRGFTSGFYKAQILTAALLCVALALVLDLVLLGIGRLLTPWTRRRAA